MIFLFLVAYCFSLASFEKVVIWGHKLHSHTHSYIHQGFYDAFIHMGYSTYWLDDGDDVGEIDFSDALFLTEGQVDRNIPLRQDGIYILHNCTSPKYRDVKKITLQVYTKDVLSAPNAKEVSPFIFFDEVGKCLYMPWATNLLPDQIEQNKQLLSKTKKEKKASWVGTIGDGYFGNRKQLSPFIAACEENKIRFFSPNPGATGISDLEHQKLIRSSYMAPAIVGEWQEQVGYIPCRIFKNISYGQMGITNSKEAFLLFQKKIVYNSNTYQLFYDAKERLQTTTLKEIEELMDFVKDHHTYLNRVDTILHFLETIGYINDAR